MSNDLGSSSSSSCSSRRLGEHGGVHKKKRKSETDYRRRCRSDQMGSEWCRIEWTCTFNFIQGGNRKEHYPDGGRDIKRGSLDYFKPRTER